MRIAREIMRRHSLQQERCRLVAERRRHWHRIQTGRTTIRVDRGTRPPALRRTEMKREKTRHRGSSEGRKHGELFPIYMMERAKNSHFLNVKSGLRLPRLGAPRRICRWPSKPGSRRAVPSSW
jgi:hypothetical protein